MPSLFDDDFFIYNNKVKDHKKECTGSNVKHHKKECTESMCQLIKELSSPKYGGTNSHRNKPVFLIINKGTSQPLSLDGSNTPTLFTLEKFDPDTCYALFSFEDILDTSPLQLVRRIYAENCHDISGIAFLEEESCDPI